MNLAFKPEQIIPRGHAVSGTVVLPRPRSEVLEWTIFSVFISGLTWTPFWWGSNEPIAWGINAILFPGLAIVFELSVLVRRSSHPVGLRLIKVPATLFVLLVLWIVFQKATWSPSFLHHPIWALASDALQTPVPGSISVDRDLTAQALMRLLTSASVFWLTLQLCRDGSRASAFVLALALIGAGYAVYGIASFALAPGSLHQIGSEWTHGFVSSTFYNRNNFATYAGLAVIALFGWILEEYEAAVATAGPMLRLKFASLIESAGRTGALLLVLLFVLAMAILLTGSRGGLIATATGVFCLIGLSLSRSSSDATGALSICIAVAVLAAVSLLFFGDLILGPILDRGVADQTRTAVYLITAKSILSSPILGFGYGTFAAIFPMFRDRSISVLGQWEMAHNTYLEELQGLGLIFGSFLLICIFMLVWKVFRGALSRINAFVPRVAMAGAVLVGVQSLVDFSLQIQAVTLAFAALLGAGVAQSVSSKVPLHD